jgi:glycosyltransferase involved in cell wall biosynthesis
LKLLTLYETVFPEFIGGIEHHNYEIAKVLRRRGHLVTLGGFGGGAPSLEPNPERLSLGPFPKLYSAGGRRSTRQAIRFAQALTRLDLSPYDVVQTANFPYIHLLPLAIKCARARRPLLVTWYEFWGPYWPDYVGRLRAPVYRAIEWWCAQQGTRVTTLSELTRKRLAAVRRGPVDLAPGGIFLDQVQGAAVESDAPGPPLFFAGRLLFHKRLDLLLEAVALLAKGDASPGALLTIFGEGPERPRLEALARARGLESRVVFRGHVESIAEVWRHLAAAEVAVQPSAREGFGLFPLEAMALGKPVVYCMSSESAVDELVRDGIDGIAVEPEPAALAQALRQLMGAAGRSERERLGESGRVRAGAYGYDEIGAHTEALCLELIAQQRR